MIKSHNHHQQKIIAFLRDHCSSPRPLLISTIIAHFHNKANIAFPVVSQTYLNFVTFYHFYSKFGIKIIILMHLCPKNALTFVHKHRK